MNRVEMALVTVLVVVDANTENVMDDAENAAVVVVRRQSRWAAAALPTAHAVRQTRMQMK